MGLPLDADPFVVDAGLVAFVLDKPVLPVGLVPLVVLNVVSGQKRMRTHWILFISYVPS